MKSEEEHHDLPSCDEALPELCVDGLDDEQVGKIFGLLIVVVSFVL